MGLHITRRKKNHRIVYIASIIHRLYYIRPDMCVLCVWMTDSLQSSTVPRRMYIQEVRIIISHFIL